MRFNELEANSLKKHVNGNDAVLLRILAARDPPERRDRSEEHYRGFQLAEGAFQLAIVLASISIVARAVALVWLSAGSGSSGSVCCSTASSSS